MDYIRIEYIFLTVILKYKKKNFKDHILLDVCLFNDSFRLKILRSNTFFCLIQKSSFCRFRDTSLSFNASAKRYVITNPPDHFKLLPTDQVIQYTGQYVLYVQHILCVMKG